MRAPWGWSVGVETCILLLLPGAELPSWKFWPSQRPLSTSHDPGRRLSSFWSSFGRCPVRCYPPICTWVFLVIFWLPDFWLLEANFNFPNNNDTKISYPLYVCFHGKLKSQNNLARLLSLSSPCYTYSVQTAVCILRGVKWFKSVMVGKHCVIELDPLHREIQLREKCQPTGDRWNVGHT